MCLINYTTECELETKLGNWTSEFMVFDGKEYEMKNLIANYEWKGFWDEKVNDLFSLKNIE